MLQQLIYTAPALLICLTVHELCHGLVAYLLGDPTAKNMGRLTLNPLRHLDPIGTIMMVVVGFGFAKPVPINPGYFRRPKSGVALVSIAGPLSNLIMGFVGMLIHVALLVNVGPGYVGNYFHTFFQIFIIYNITLCVFNLIPIPPLDGSKVLVAALPDRAANLILRYERYGMIVIFALLWIGVLDGPLSAARNFVWDGMAGIALWIFT